MLRDIFMTAIGAASALGVLVVITIVLKVRERAELHRLGLARSGEFPAIMRQHPTRDETFEEYFQRTEMSSFSEFD